MNATLRPLAELASVQSLTQKNEVGSGTFSSSAPVALPRQAVVPIKETSMAEENPQSDELPPHLRQFDTPVAAKMREKVSGPFHDAFFPFQVFG